MGHLTSALLCGMSSMPSREHSEVAYLIPDAHFFFSTKIWVPYILVGTESSLVPSSDLAYSRELHSWWSALTKDVEVKRFLRNKRIVQSAGSFIPHRGLSYSRFLKSVSHILLSDTNIRKRYSVGIPTPYMTDPPRVAVLLSLTHSRAFLHM